MDLEFANDELEQRTDRDEFPLVLFEGGAQQALEFVGGHQLHLRPLAVNGCVARTFARPPAAVQRVAIGRG